MKNILWIGPIINPNKIKDFKALSPAANNWQISLIKTLISLGHNLNVISYIPEPFFPKGRIRIPIRNLQFNDFPLTYISYINLPLLRDYSLAINILIKLHQIKGSTIIITYNNSKAHIIAARFLQNRPKSKWINILADGNYAQNPDLTVFLSYGFYIKAKLLNKFHLDGGINGIRETIASPSVKKTILFNGALSKWTGIEEFALQFSLINQSSFELHIYGKGDSTLLNKLAGQSNKIILKGFVNENELDIARRNAYAFVNPRPTNIQDGEKNFPSKILEYLQYGKPILSTHTEGLSPCYNDILLFYDPAKSESLESKLIYLNNILTSEYKILRDKMLSFCKEHTWEQQAKRLIVAIESI